ncbi:hypothetical protein D3C72_1703140 [compost metagenome]
MNFLNKIFSFFQRRDNKIEVKNITTGTIHTSEYSFHSFIDSDSSFENSFFEYKSFFIEDKNVTYTVILFFLKDDDTDIKEEIFSFIKDGFEKKVDCQMIFLNTSIIYDILVCHKGVPDENKLKIFIGNVDI